MPANDGMEALGTAAPVAAGVLSAGLAVAEKRGGNPRRVNAETNLKTLCTGLFR